MRLNLLWEVAMQWIEEDDVLIYNKDKKMLFNIYQNT